MTVMAKLSVAALALSSTVTRAAAAWPQSGRCDRTDYMNVGWGGMSLQGCRERAWQVKRDGSQCDFVSISESSEPVSAGNFCQCHRACGSLAYPQGEEWQTFEVEEVSSSAGSDDDGQVLAIIAACVAAGAVLVCCAVGAGVYCYRKRQARGLPPLQAKKHNVASASAAPADDEPAVAGVVVETANAAAGAAVSGVVVESTNPEAASAVTGTVVDSTTKTGEA
eukprot:TRINITY_DN6193_c0_g1_i1.p1 TRINITY_DN6193_c0_g1~~TRINITY_DN6193_c0_g1_i1.p1  ORF type:complete len:223 (+),score=30.04 TRINITY_DN6193_c0_g1_i1:158-826(+)